MTKLDTVIDKYRARSSGSWRGEVGLDEDARTRIWEGRSQARVKAEAADKESLVDLIVTLLWVMFVDVLVEAAREVNTETSLRCVYS